MASSTFEQRYMWWQLAGVVMDEHVSLQNIQYGRRRYRIMFMSLRSNIDDSAMIKVWYRIPLDAPHKKYFDYARISSANEYVDRVPMHRLEKYGL